MKQTDLERFVALYASFGITCILNKNADGSTWIELANGGYGKLTTESEKFDGYSGFYSTIEFDQNGTFIKQGFWE